MKSKIVYKDESLGPIRIIPDFLPPPEQLAFKERSRKITIGLSGRSVDFFKAEAQKCGAPYQLMIRRLLDIYVERQMAVRSATRAKHRTGR